jgi:hypothetical protein
MAFSGTLLGGSGNTIIQCHWTGSEGGIADLATPANNSFIDPTLLTGTGNHDNVGVPGSTVSHSVDLAMADNAQSFSRTKTPHLNTSKEVGVITFKWVRNGSTLISTVTNISNSQIIQTLQGGAKQAVFTGNAADTGHYVYVSGRDNQSGTRVNAFGISGFGILTIPSQIELDSGGNMIDLAPPSGDYIDDAGFSSGGTLAGTLGTDTSGKTDNAAGLGAITGFSVVAYLSVGDAGNAITAGAKELTYNGYAFSSAAVKEGTYDFWGNEYIFQSNTAGTEAQSVYANLIATTGIATFIDGTKAIKLTDMHCTRSGPTSPPQHN